MIKQIKIFRDLVGQDEDDKEKSINIFLKENWKDLDSVENFVTNEGEIIVIIQYFTDKIPLIEKVE